MRREFLLEKINTQEREWDRQLDYLRTKVSCFDFNKRKEFAKYVEHLDSKLKTIQVQTSKIRNAGPLVWEKHGEDISECWNILVHNVDYVISNYVKIFNR